MRTVTRSRRLDRSPDDVRAKIRDTGRFMRAAGFDEVDVDSDEIKVVNRVGPVEIELALREIDKGDETVVLAYEQVEGIFRKMWTTYAAEETGDGGTNVTAHTAFELGGGGISDVIDSTVIARQRRKELDSQLDYLDARET